MQRCSYSQSAAAKSGAFFDARAIIPPRAAADGLKQSPNATEIVSSLGLGGANQNLPHFTVIRKIFMPRDDFVFAL